MKIALYLKNELRDSKLEKTLRNEISKKGFLYDEVNPEVVIFVGGDGTFLRAVNHYLDQIDKVQFVGLSEGTLGFYSDFTSEQLDDLFEAVKEKSKVVEMSLIEAKIGKDVIYAVNEVRIENPFHTLISKVYIDDEYLETFRGNGLTICTSYGSSAYNKSLSGAVVSPDIETLQLNEIAPINNRVYRSLNSPLVLSNKQTVVLEGDFKEAVIGYDHLTTKKDASRIHIKLSEKKAKIIYRKEHSYVSQLVNAFLK